MFTGLASDRMDLLVAMSQRRTYRRGEMIFQQGDPCPGIFIVDTGVARIYKLAPSGKEHVSHMAR